MRDYIRITFITFTIWLLSAFINGVLCGIFLSISKKQPAEWAEDVIGIFLISLFFSVPGFFVFWISLMISFARWVRERALFRTALSAGFILSVFTGLMFSGMFSYDFPQKYLLMLFIVLSASISIMFHFKHFKKIN